MTQKIYWGNFDFEYQLAGATQLPPRLKRIGDEMAFCWTAIAHSDDQVLVSGRVDESYAEYLTTHGFFCPEFTIEPKQSASSQFVPWGWSQAATNIGKGHSENRAPSVEVVKRLNSRVWAAQQEQKWNGPDSVSQIVRSEEELQKALALFSATEDWLLKSNLSMSGRDRIVGTGSSLTTPHAGWIRNRFKNNQVLILERRLNSLEEVGILFEIPTEGKPQLIDVLPMLTDRTGRYCGSWILQREELIKKWKQELADLQKIATQIQEEGYFGPVGFDVMRYRTASGEEKTRLFQDINCRFTMGRLASGWRRYLKENEIGCWVHFATRCKTINALQDWWTNFENANQIPAGRLFRTSPLSLDGEIVQHQTAFIVARTEADITKAYHEFLTANENC